MEIPGKGWWPAVRRRCRSSIRTGGVTGKSLFLLGSMILATMGVFPERAGATLHAEYREMERRRMELDRTRRDLEKEMSEIQERHNKYSTGFLACRNLKWRIYWEPRWRQAEDQGKEVEIQRKKIEAARIRLEDRRKELELERERIEESFRGKGRGEGYEKQFRGYMRSLEETYLSRVEPELFAAYRSYFDAERAHIQFINESREICEKGNFSGAVLEAADKSINLIKQKWMDLRRVLSGG